MLHTQGILSLPFPPSVNTYYTVARGRKILSKKGREYKAMCLPGFDDWGEPLECDIWLTLIFTMPDKRRRDLDNYFKAVLDLLTDGGVYKDDSQVVSIHAIKEEVEKPGGVKVLVETWEQPTLELLQSDIKKTNNVINFPYDRLNPHSD